MNIAHLLHRTARLFPNHPGVGLGESVRLSYAELADRTGRVARALTEKFRLHPGDRVMLAMKNNPAYFELLFGCWQAGMAAVPVNAKLHPRELTYILQNSESRLCFATADLAGDLQAYSGDCPDFSEVIDVEGQSYEALLAPDGTDHVAEVAPDALAWLFYTSGTTGRPKGAMLTHRNLLIATMNYFADVDQIAGTDCIIHAAPLSHGSGLYALPHVAKGACNVIPASGGFDMAEVSGLFASLRGATMFLAPTMVHRLINHPGIDAMAAKGLKTIVYGGGPMYVEDSLAALALVGNKLVQIYGQGEAPMTITGLGRTLHQRFDGEDEAGYRARLGSAGVARTDVEVLIVDGDDRPVPPGEIGEIVCRGDVVMAGYWRNPQASADTLRNGWLHTGDLGAMDHRGYVTLKDRSKDMIISGGSNIYPREIEEVLLRHETVAEVSVVGRPHPDWGEEVVAFVVEAEPGRAKPADLDAFCLENIARFKRPKEYRIVDSLPKNNYGKVLKTALRELL